MSSQNDLMLDVSQAHELKLAFRRNGWTNSDIKALCEGDILSDVLGVVKGHAEIRHIHFINCDAAPFIPEGWGVEENRKGGVKHLPENIVLYLAKKQEKEIVSGYDLRKELADKPVFNANMLDWLLAHPELIPDSWKGQCVFFWGTIYRNPEGCLVVRYLYFGDNQWKWDYSLLDSYFYSNYPAAVAT